MDCKRQGADASDCAALLVYSSTPKEKQMSKFVGKLIASGSNAKTVKGDKASEFETAIMYLAPHESAGGINLCSMAALAACIEGCLNTAGRAGIFAAIPAARIRKTRLYRDDRAAFMAALHKDVARFAAWCMKRGRKPAVRLNGTSDIQFERGHSYTVNGVRYASIFEAFPEVTFYDYTKIAARVSRLPSNYSLTLSYSGANSRYYETILPWVQAGTSNMAVVFRTKARAEEAIRDGWNGYPVVSGDETDLRFLDPQGGYVVALYAKGRAKKDTSGFVVD